MSRIGNRVLTIPSGVEVTLDGNKITTKGPKGTLEFNFKNANVDVKVEDGKVYVWNKFANAKVRVLWRICKGLTKKLYSPT